MTSLRCALLSICLVPALAAGLAQQTVNKPAPAAAPAINHPWYVLGPGHRWPYALLPFYKVCEWLPFTRPAALRLGLVTLDQLLLALVEAVESPVQGTRIVGVPEIRSAGLNLSHDAARKSA